jgi:hypothetical protein
VCQLPRWLNTLSGKRWGCDPISTEEVERAIADGHLEGDAWDIAQNRVSDSIARNFHIRRIAYLVKHACALEKDDRHPILFEPDSDTAAQNGNHRIAAAQIRGDTEIAVKLFIDGDDPNDVVLKLLPCAHAL